MVLVSNPSLFTFSQAQVSVVRDFLGGTGWTAGANRGAVVKLSREEQAFPARTSM